VEPETHWPEASQLKPEPQVPQLPLQPSEPQTFPEQFDEQTTPTLNVSVRSLLPSSLSGIRSMSSTNART
jgi:hypothetical protein